MRPAAEVVDRLEPDAGQVVAADLFLGDLQSSDSPAVDRDNVLEIRRLQTMVPGAVQEPRVARSSLGRYSGIIRPVIALYESLRGAPESPLYPRKRTLERVSLDVRF